MDAAGKERLRLRLAALREELGLEILVAMVDQGGGVLEPVTSASARAGGASVEQRGETAHGTFQSTIELMNAASRSFGEQVALRPLREIVIAGWDEEGRAEIGQSGHRSPRDLALRMMDLTETLLERASAAVRGKRS